MKVSSDQEALLDRGGRPTLRELLSHLAFSPINGTLRLGNTRMILQRVSFLSHLREEIASQYGREDAFILLTRLGFQAGYEDSQFVHSSWPNLDLGDAFTAGTRLHTVSGIVRVETVHNDFDFKKGKFSGEFLWHESAEASEHRKHYGDAREPVCWSLVGYASGYATHSLGKLIVYKETECKAMGHKQCRVVGKPAEVWGEDDAVVQLFRKKIMPRLDGIWPRQDAIADKRPRASGRSSDAPATLEELILAPVEAQIAKAINMELPLLITGPAGSGKMIAANYAAKLALGDARQPQTLIGHGLDAAALHAALGARTRKAGRSNEGDCIVLQEVDALDSSCQTVLENHLRQYRSSDAMPLVVATTAAPLSILNTTARLRPVLRQLLTRMRVDMPSLRERRSEFPALVKTILEQLCSRHGLPDVKVEDTAIRELSKLSFDGNLVELETLLLSILMSGAAKPALDGKAVQKFLNAERHSVPGGNTDEGLYRMAATALDYPGFSLDRHNEAIYRIAMDRADGNVSAAAKLLGLSRAQLAYRLRQAGEALLK